MRIAFGAIGKGYAANKAKQVMAAMRIQNGAVDASGDILAWGNKADGNPWVIGITNPLSKTEIFSWLEVNDMAVVTSGNYEKYVEFEGQRYGHIIHPQTGWPVSGTQSVTVICPDAELADGLATALFIMGPEKSIDLVNQLNGIETIIISDQNDVFASQNILIDSNKIKLKNKD